MAKRQTRRSISVAKLTYEKLQTYAREQGTSCSGIVETLLAPILREVAPTPPVKEVVVTTPVLEKRGHWEPRAAPILKDPVKADLGDPSANKIFTF